LVIACSIVLPLFSAELMMKSFCISFNFFIIFTLVAVV
jgi:hypothetical protein